MNILLVDDDEYIVQALKEKTDWCTLGIESIYTAYNIAQAKELLANLPIQIMVCDIEMPQGSGLELLAWIREQGMDIQTLFLTSYADFSYARRAIELQSLNYYLKPVDYRKLEMGIREACDRANEQVRQEKYKKESEYWTRNKGKILREFYHSLMNPDGIKNDDELASAIKNAALGYGTDTRFWPLWLELFDDRGSLDKWEGMRLILTVEKLAAKAGQGILHGDVKAVPMEHLSFVVLLEMPEDELPFLAIQNFAEKFSDECREAFNVEVFIGIGCQSAMLDLRSSVDALRKLRENCVTRESRIVSVIDHENREIPYHLPAITAWEALLSEHRVDEFLEEVRTYLEALKNQDQLNREILKLFRMDIIQLMYAHLKKTEIQASRVLINEEGELLYKKSADCIDSMMVYVRYLTKNAVNYADFAGKPDSVVWKIQRYIDQNFNREITRNDLAGIVYLNPDYISRLFKKKTGMSISTYLLKKRIDLAKELLENTSMPVNVISTHVGYENYSYFTRMFRENTGYTPNEYRKKIKADRTL